MGGNATNSTTGGVWWTQIDSYRWLGGPKSVGWITSRRSTGRMKRVVAIIGCTAYCSTWSEIICFSLPSACFTWIWTVVVFVAAPFYHCYAITFRIRNWITISSRTLNCSATTFLLINWLVRIIPALLTFEGATHRMITNLQMLCCHVNFFHIGVQVRGSSFMMFNSITAAKTTNILQLIFLVTC